MLHIVEGDLIRMALDGEFDVIVHGANCFHTMGAGIAKQIKVQLPVAYAADLGTRKGNINKIGEFSVGEVVVDETGKVLRVVNAYTQYLPGANAEYAALRMFLCSFFAHELMRENADIRYGFPLIGCGIGGLDENIVIPMIEPFSKTFDITVVKFLQ